MNENTPMSTYQTGARDALAVVQETLAEPDLVTAVVEELAAQGVDRDAAETSVRLTLASVRTAVELYLKVAETRIPTDFYS